MGIVFCNSNDKRHQALLNDLLKDIFLDFQFWYDLDLWDENYESYSIMEDGVIVSNICLYKTRILFRGKHYSAFSVGAVGTRKEYRGRGYSKQLMEHIIDKYGNVPMYLFANDSVAGFYPKFGFRRVYEKLPVVNRKIDSKYEPKKLNYRDHKVWKYINSRKNYSTYLDSVNSAKINMFHIHLGYLRIYEIEELKTMIIAKQSGNVLKIVAVFATEEYSFSELVNYLPFQRVEEVEFGFIPHWDDCEYTMKEYEHDPCFVRGVECNLGDFKFPELAIT